MSARTPATRPQPLLRYLHTSAGVVSVEAYGEHLQKVVNSFKFLESRPMAGSNIYHAIMEMTQVLFPVNFDLERGIALLGTVSVNSKAFLLRGRMVKEAEFLRDFGTKMEVVKNNMELSVGALWIEESMNPALFQESRIFLRQCNILFRDGDLPFSSHQHVCAIGKLLQKPLFTPALRDLHLNSESGLLPKAVAELEKLIDDYPNLKKHLEPLKEFFNLNKTIHSSVQELRLTLLEGHNGGDQEYRSCAEALLELAWLSHKIIEMAKDDEYGQISDVEKQEAQEDGDYDHLLDFQRDLNEVPVVVTRKDLENALGRHSSRSRHLHHLLENYSLRTQRRMVRAGMTL